MKPWHTGVFGATIACMACVGGGLIIAGLIKKEKPIQSTTETRFYVLDSGCLLDHRTNMKHCYYYFGDRLTGGIFLSDGVTSTVIIMKGKWK